MATTIKDVAALAGVSPSTVSRVCNDHPSISRETRLRVRQAMQELGYEANVASDTGTSSPVRMIGIILPSSLSVTYENSFYLRVVRGITQVCNQRAVASTIITGEDDAEMLSTVQFLQQSGQVDGFILLYSKKDDPIVDYLGNQGALYVVIGKVSHLSSQTICIDNDNLIAGREATEYLWSLGHRRIGYLGNEDIFVFSAERKSGYQLALLQHDLPLNPDYCIETQSPRMDDTGALQQLLTRPDRPTAFVTSDDLLAVGLERICVQLGLRIPEDVSIVSFNNSLFSQLISPQLTSMDVNAFQLGFEAATQVINHAENPNLMATKIIIPHHMIKRASCCKPQENA